jgi:hypothetical protein
MLKPKSKLQNDKPQNKGRLFYCSLSKHYFLCPVLNNKKMMHKNFLSIVFCFSAVVVFSQSWQDHINKINNYTNGYDPYKRHFTYEPSTRKLTWITDDGDITCSVYVEDVTVFTEPSGNNYYVSFSCKDNSKCIYSSYGGNTNITSITITSKYYADEIVKEILAIGGGSAPVAVAVAAPPPVSSGGNNAIARINELCRQYDPYIRTFSYDSSRGVITWVNKDGDITCSATLSKVSVSVVANTSDFSVMFTCNNSSKCIDSNYLGATERSSVTVTNRAAADEIVNKINSLK